MKSFQIINGKIIAPSGICDNKVLLIENGLIGELADNIIPSYDILDAERAYVCPGFFDIHCHGAAGCDFMESNSDSFKIINDYHLSHGTTSLLATTVAASDGSLLSFLAAFNDFKKTEYSNDILAGVHLEGPYLCKGQAGAQDPSYIKNPSESDYIKILNSSKYIKIWTAAPELDGVKAFAKECVKRNVRLSAGHTGADFSQIGQALKENGFNQITHIYSGMNGIIRKNARRIAGPVEAALFFDDIFVEMIADGVHLPPELLNYVLKIKGPDKIALITDATAAAGLPEGKAYIGGKDNGREIIVDKDVAMMPCGTSFAGSITTADKLVLNMIKYTTATLPEAVNMMTAVPAKMAGCDNVYGSLSKGKIANILFIDDNVNIKKIILRGKIIK